MDQPSNILALFVFFLAAAAMLGQEQCPDIPPDPTPEGPIAVCAIPELGVTSTWDDTRHACVLSPPEGVWTVVVTAEGYGEEHVVVDFASMSVVEQDVTLRAEDGSEYVVTIISATPFMPACGY